MFDLLLIGTFFGRRFVKRTYECATCLIRNIRRDEKRQKKEKTAVKIKCRFDETINEVITITGKE